MAPGGACRGRDPAAAARDARAGADRAARSCTRTSTCSCSTSRPAWSCIPAPGTREARWPPPSWRMRPASPASEDRGGPGSCIAWTRTPRDSWSIGQDALGLRIAHRPAPRPHGAARVPSRWSMAASRRRGSRRQADRARATRPHPDGGEAGGARRRAVTRWRVLERFAEFTHLEARLETGRTAPDSGPSGLPRPPVAGDSVYGGRRRRPLPGRGGARAARGRLGFLNPRRPASRWSSPRPAAADRTAAVSPTQRGSP